MPNLARNPILALTLGMLAAQSAWAQNWSPVLGNTALADFTQQDLHLLTQEGSAFLDGAVTLLEWRNPATGAGGSFKLIDAETTKGQTCKRVLVQVHSRKYPAQPAVRVRACREGTGSWKLVPTPTTAPSTKPE